MKQLNKTVNYTRLTSTKKPITKTISIDKDGNASKESSAKLTQGDGMRITEEFPDEFAKHLDSANEYEANCYGIPNQDVFKVVVAGKENPDKNVISRTREFFKFSNKPGVMSADYDPIKGREPIPVDVRLNILGKIHPELECVSVIHRGSVSSSVLLDGKPAFKSAGDRIFIPILDMSDITRYAIALYVKLWLMGYGHIELGANGMPLEKSIIDMATIKPEALDFIGPPVIDIDYQDRLKYKKPKITIHDPLPENDLGLLDTRTLADPTEEEIANYHKIVKQQKLALKQQAEQKSEEWTQNKIKLLIENGTDPIEAEMCVRNISKSQYNDLYNEFIINFKGGSATVTEILKDPSRYAGKPCYDPVEGPEYGHITGKLFVNQDGTVIINSRAHGIDTRYFLKSITADDFDIFEEDTPRSLSDDIPEWQKRYDEQVHKFNERHASITIGGKHRIKRDTHESIEEVRNIRHEFFTVTDIRSLNSHELVQTGVKFHKNGGETPIMQNIVDAWLKHPDCRRYEDGIVFAPNKKTPNTVFNTWEGFAVEPVEGCKHIPMNEHIEHDICRDNKVLTEYVFNWIAFTYQHPEIPARVALVVRGKKGCGKGTLGHFLMKLWGNHGVHISNSRHLVGQFNAHLGDKCFLFADEAFYSGNKADEPTLKALITEPTMMVERKGIDAQQERNYLKVFMATNSEYAVPASKDERRYCVIDVSDEHIGDKKYFDRLYKACDDKEAQSSFLYEMLNRDISEFNIGDVPETSALMDQRLHSFDSVQKFVHQYLDQCEVDPYKGWGWESSSRMYEMYLDYCHSIRLSEYKIQTQNQLSTYLGKVFTAKQNTKGHRERGFEFGSLDEARATFSEYEKIQIDWEIEQTVSTDEYEEDDYV